MARDFFQTLLLKSGVAVLSVLLFAQSGQASTVTNPFKMFKRYFGTIEIASNGKGTRGTGQVDTTAGITQGLSLTKCSYPDDIGIGCTIKVPVPAGVELVAAFIYYEVLEKTQAGSLDITEWLTWFLGCLDRAIEQSSRISDSALEKELFWQDLKKRNLSPNDRQKKVLNKLFSGFEGKLTRDKWMKITKTSSEPLFETSKS